MPNLIFQYLTCMHLQIELHILQILCCNSEFILTRKGSSSIQNIYSKYVNMNAHRKLKKIRENFDRKETFYMRIIICYALF